MGSIFWAQEQLTRGKRLVQLKMVAVYSTKGNYLASSFNRNITKELTALLKSAGKKDSETLNI